MTLIFDHGGQVNIILFLMVGYMRVQLIFENNKNDWCCQDFLNIDTCVMCALHRKSIFLLLLMVKNKKVTIKNTNFLIDSTSTTTN